LDRLERLAWSVRVPTRRLFVVLAIWLALLLGLSGLVSGAVLSRNASTIDSVRDSGLGVAEAAAEFRTELAAADAQAAATLISGGLEAPERRAAYDESILKASTALTQAALVGEDEDSGDIGSLSDGLLDFTGNVATSRANSRQGYPVGAAYLSQARIASQDDLVPRADRLRRSGEQRVAEAANSVGGAASGVGIAVLFFAVAGLIGGAALVAGRTRRIVHPALAVAVIASMVAFILVITGVGSQSTELRHAATDDLPRFVSANEVSSTLSNLRVTEINAVAARGSGEALFDQFSVDAAALLESVTSAPLASAGIDQELREALREYIAGVEAVEAADEAGDNREAADLTLNGASSAGFQRATVAASNAVMATGDDVTARVDAAESGSVDATAPIVLFGLAAALAAIGVLARARRYR
jgi:hypothetical protein